jgi:hypothetical protein
MSHNHSMTSPIGNRTVRTRNRRPKSRSACSASPHKKRNAKTKRPARSGWDLLTVRPRSGVRAGTRARARNRRPAVPREVPSTADRPQPLEFHCSFVVRRFRATRWIPHSNHGIQRSRKPSRERTPHGWTIPKIRRRPSQIRRCSSWSDLWFIGRRFPLELRARQQRSEGQNGRNREYESGI